MILVQVEKNWLQVLTGSLTADDAILGEWPGIAEHQVRQYGDVLVGLYRNTIVGAYDIDQEKTTYGPGKVKFAGTASTRWANAVGKHNPGRPWTQGGGDLVQFLNTSTARITDGPAAGAPADRQVSLDGFVLSVDGHGNASVFVPAGRALTLRTA